MQFLGHCRHEVCRSTASVTSRIFTFLQSGGLFSLDLVNAYILSAMKTSSFITRYWAAGVLLLGCTFSSSLFAHQVTGVNGKSNHQHAYKSNAYGKGATEGHYAQPAGSKGIVIWQASPSRTYGKTQPGFKVPKGNKSQKQMYGQKPVFTKNQNRTPVLKRK